MNIKSNLISILATTALLSSMHSMAQAQVTAPGPAPTQASEIEIIDTTTPDSSTPIVSQDVQIDEKELPGESVVPKTDITTAVLNKRLRQSGRVMLDFAAGNVLDEPLVNANYYLIRASYFGSDEMSYGLGVKTRFGGQTTYSQQLKEGSAALDFERAPAPTQSLFLSLGYHFYYGKISLSKDSTMTATTKFDTDLGMQKSGSSQKPFVQAALTQSLFFNKQIALGLSYGISLAQVYDPTSVNIRSTQPIPAESDFSQKIRINQYLSLNLSTLF
jgi:hypothetical protein